MGKWQVKVTQNTDELSDHEDMACLPAGGDFEGSFRLYDYPGEDEDDEEDILDWFHDTVPIGCLDDFDIEVVERGKNIVICLDNVDWPLLAKQKIGLVVLSDRYEDPDSPDAKAFHDAIMGIVHLLDEVQDQAVKQIGEVAVFGRVLGEEEPPQASAESSTNPA